MGQALYRKYRSKTLDEVIGQDHITQTLAQALQQDRISHAYLFTGPRGVGKTSVARIWAHVINDLPYVDDSLHIDIIEIDAASNRRIDEIRELRDKVYVAPTSATYKVYIIDEVHMLTREAFNALLKTLEEPPAHVVFILATTDAHKLPDTIVSRTQRFSFKPVDPAKVVAHLRHIADTEVIKVSDEALELLAHHGDGSFRDSISLLDQASSHSQFIEVSDVQRLLGIPPADALQQLLSVTAAGNSASLMTNLTALYDQGYQATAIAAQLGRAVRSQLISNASTLESETIFKLLEQLIDVPASRDPERSLEITLLRVNPQGHNDHQDDKNHKSSDQAKKLNPEIKTVTSTDSTATITKTKTVAQTVTLLDGSSWPTILQALKQRHNTLYGVVRMAEPDFSSDDKLKLAFAFAFHQKRIKENSNQQKLADIINEITGRTVSIECYVNKSATPPMAALEPALQPLTSDLAAISNIFGESELLES